MEIFDWSPDSTPDTGVWIVNKCDIDDFLVVAEEFDSNTIYIINQDSQYYSIGYIYLYLKHRGNIQGIESRPDIITSDITTTSATISVMESLKNYDIKGAIRYLNLIIGDNNGGHRYDKLIHHLEVLIDINAIFFNNVIAGSIYGHLTRKTWWLEKQYLIDVLNKIGTEVKKLPKILLDDITSRIDNYKKISDILSKNDVEDILKVLSAFCYSFVPYYINNNYNITAYLLVHRSLDLFFASDAIHHGFVEVKKEGLTYQNQSVSVDDYLPRIHLYRTYFDYVVLADKLPFEQEESIRTINKKRNELLHTHGVDSVSNQEITDAYEKAGNIMKKNVLWKEQKSNFRTRLAVDVTEIINIAHNININNVAYEYKTVT